MQDGQSWVSFLSIAGGCRQCSNVERVRCCSQQPRSYSSATGAQAQTTGRIMGQVVDAQGAALPGATVTVSSPNLQGAQTQVTDSEGNYRFLSLPPGRYTVKVELASFKTVEQSNVDVGLDRTVTLPSRCSLRV